jgi:3-hydroxybutyryl-CoA dehydrogenase
MKIHAVGIIGSGIMGSGIAEVAASSGFDVLLRSRSEESAAQMVSTISQSLERRVSRGKLDDNQATATLNRLRTTTDLDALRDCDLIIESVVEDLDTKRHLFAHLGTVTRPDAILATNTSTLPIINIAAATSHPERVLGIHFFNPATVMGLVEIVRPITATDDFVDAAHDFARACGKHTVNAKDEAGFVVNALLFPYLNSAIELLERGVASMEDIDASMRLGCAFPMGPFQLLDLVGLDTSLAILDALFDERGLVSAKAAPTLRRLVASGRLGKKSGAGFYDYP